MILVITSTTNLTGHFDTPKSLLSHFWSTSDLIETNFRTTTANSPKTSAQKQSILNFRVFYYKIIHKLSNTVSIDFKNPGFRINYVPQIIWKFWIA